MVLCIIKHHVNTTVIFRSKLSKTRTLFKINLNSQKQKSEGNIELIIPSLSISCEKVFLAILLHPMYFRAFGKMIFPEK